MSQLPDRYQILSLPQRWNDPISSRWNRNKAHCWTSHLPVLRFARHLHRSNNNCSLVTTSLALGLVYIVVMGSVLCGAKPAPVHAGSATLSNGKNPLIWPHEIEDNALAEQDGDFVYKKATAAEKQEQKSSSSIFFWPSSQGGNHHNHHHRSSRNSSHSVVSSSPLSISSLLLLCLAIHWLLLYRP